MTCSRQMRHMSSLEGGPSPAGAMLIVSWRPWTMRMGCISVTLRWRPFVLMIDSGVFAAARFLAGVRFAGLARQHVCWRIGRNRIAWRPKSLGNHMVLEIRSRNLFADCRKIRQPVVRRNTANNVRGPGTHDQYGLYRALVCRLDYDDPGRLYSLPTVRISHRMRL